MNKIGNILDASQWLIIGFTITDLNQALNTILLLISIILGVVSIVIKVINASKDGKITEDELNDIKKDVDDLNDKIK